MAHYRRAVGAATLLNTAIFIGEAGAGLHARSLSLLTDSVHNIWQSLERLARPVRMSGLAPVLGGLAAAAANWGVARLLRAPARANAAIRLAYIHNLGDIVVSLVPVAAGLLVILTSRPAFDALLALGTALWLILSTARSLRGSGEELLWPEAMTCGHHMDRPAVGAR